ncbi:PREDICTED: probable 28S ribosomal protein S26, mitochondrial [Priapulus caudatus]|uniref:Small ribosomal subunit protein mS26 n=1 Tax=Priapulus caudatus TaxID=37621 RepID=A0ABM1DNN5_PRICU|nr:PREDICTED: probable 28S ribosomal protein S26, mitochondrial [Priapulus caudatus]
MISAKTCLYLYGPGKQGLRSPCGSLVFVRWRKPRWIPMAKSKLEYLPVKKPVDPWEADFMKKQMNHYRTTMKALRAYFACEQEALSATGTVMMEKARHEEDEFRALLEENARHNEHVAAMREKRIADEQEARLLARMRGIEFAKQRRAEEREHADSVIQHYQELAKTLVTAETCDEAIEQCLDDVIVYDFAIDQTGSVYQGRTLEVLEKVSSLSSSSPEVSTLS